MFFSSVLHLKTTKKINYYLKKHEKLLTDNMNLKTLKINKIIKDNKAQISAEMIILLAAIIAVVLLVVTQLQKTTQKANTTVDKTADDVFKKITNIK